MTETPHRERLAAMAEADQFAAMELFRGTMRRHSLIAYRDDSPLPAPGVDWDNAGWQDWVPIRPATVVVVEERLPPGVAAALINRAHTDRDLVFFADPAALRMFEAVDGSTPFGVIEGATLELVRRLWWHDLLLIATT